MKRDRDTVVTGAVLPILVKAYSGRDGFILPPDGLQIEAQILPLPAALGIFDAKKRAEYSSVYEKVSADELAQLEALALLISAVSQGEWKAAHITQYTKRMAPLETNRALRRLEEDIKKWDVRVSEGEEKLERARALHTLRERVKFPWLEMQWRLNEWLGKARVVLWLAWRDKSVLPGLYCESMAGALAALLFTKITSPESVHICERCGTPFISIKRVQRFCSLRCGNADRKARERSKSRRAKR